MFILSLRDSNVSVVDTTKEVEAVVEEATKLPDDQSPRSKVKVPAPTNDVLDV